MKKLSLPPGKITIRFRQMRGVFQCFVGRTYVNGASGETPDAAAESLVDLYDVGLKKEATVHGFNFPFKLTLNSTP